MNGLLRTLAGELPNPGTSSTAFRRPAFGDHSSFRLLSLRAGLLAVAAAWLVLAATAAQAQRSVPIMLDLQPDVTRFRSDAPMSLRFTLKTASNEIVVGRVELEFTIQGRVVGRYRSREVAPSSEGYSFQVIVPAISVPSASTLLTANATFVTDEGRTDLGQYSFGAPATWKREFLIIASHPWGQTLPPMEVDFADALRVELLTDDRSISGDLATFASRVAPWNLPLTNVGYCAFDLLLLASDGFTDLNDKQLEAIADWVEAGGSIFVVPDREAEIGHVNFLNRLLGADSAASFSLDERGRLQTPILESDEKLLMLRPGLGRAVILLESIPKNEIPNSKKWREIVAFLWKLRLDQMAEVSAHLTWKFEFSQLPTDYGPMVQVNGVEIPIDFADPFELYDTPRLFGKRASVAERIVPELLFPNQIRGISFPVIVAILIVFLLIIAPGDYFLLGYLKCRRYTWLFFPAVSLAFTWLTVHLAQQALGTADYRHGLVFVDMIEGNRAARTSRFELSFAATPRTTDTEYRNSLHTPIDPRRFGTAPDNPLNYARQEAALEMAFDPPMYEGGIPSVFRVIEPMQQWTTRLNRQTSFAEPEALPSLDWDALGREMLHSKEPVAVLGESVSTAFDQAEIWLFRGGNLLGNASIGTPLYDEFDAMESMLETERYRQTNRRATQTGQEFWYQAERLRGQQAYLSSIVVGTSIAPPPGLFSIIAQISPTGGANFEDLFIHDSSDPDEWLLVLVTRQGNDFVIYRRLYHGDP